MWTGILNGMLFVFVLTNGVESFRNLLRDAAKDPQSLYEAVIKLNFSHSYQILSVDEKDALLVAPSREMLETYFENEVLPYYQQNPLPEIVEKVQLDLVSVAEKGKYSREKASLIAAYSQALYQEVREQNPEITLQFETTLRNSQKVSVESLFASPAPPESFWMKNREDLSVSLAAFESTPSDESLVALEEDSFLGKIVTLRDDLKKQYEEAILESNQWHLVPGIGLLLAAVYWQWKTSRSYFRDQRRLVHDLISKLPQGYLAREELKGRPFTKTIRDLIGGDMSVQFSSETNLALEAIRLRRRQYREFLAKVLQEAGTTLGVKPPDLKVIEEAADIPFRSLGRAGQRPASRYSLGHYGQPVFQGLLDGSLGSELKSRRESHRLCASILSQLGIEGKVRLPLSKSSRVKQQVKEAVVRGDGARSSLLMALPPFLMGSTGVFLLEKHRKTLLENDRRHLDDPYFLSETLAGRRAYAEQLAHEAGYKLQLDTFARHLVASQLQYDLLELAKKWSEEFFLPSLDVVVPDEAVITDSGTGEPIDAYAVIYPKTSPELASRGLLLRLAYDTEGKKFSFGEAVILDPRNEMEKKMILGKIWLESGDAAGLQVKMKVETLPFLFISSLPKITAPSTYR